ncbi:MAG: methylated-DNA--[protein]-cysteine S-methyltransferase [Acetobacteraceae bacterium]
MTLSEDAGAIVALSWERAGEQHETPLLRRAWFLLGRYFSGAHEEFDLPLRPAGTAFEQGVWVVLRTIPWGEQWTYGKVARLAGGSPRAVGRAVGRNPIPIIIPCHRVVAADGLGGFSAPGGVATKRALLAHEGRLFPEFADAGSGGR